MTKNQETRRSLREHDGHGLWRGTRRAYGQDCPVWVQARGARPTRREVNRAIRAVLRLERANARARA